MAAFCMITGTTKSKITPYGIRDGHVRTRKASIATTECIIAGTQPNDYGRLKFAESSSCSTSTHAVIAPAPGKGLMISFHKAMQVMRWIAWRQHMAKRRDGQSDDDSELCGNAATACMNRQVSSVQHPLPRVPHLTAYRMRVLKGQLPRISDRIEWTMATRIPDVRTSVGLLK